MMIECESQSFDSSSSRGRLTTIKSYIFLFAAFLSAHSDAVLLGQLPESTTPVKQNTLDKDLAIYLGVGNVQGSGKIVQIDGQGEVLGSVKIESTPYDLYATRDFVFAVLPGSGGIIRVFRNGHVSPLKSTGGIGHPVAIAAHAETGRVYIGDNSTDTIVRMTPGRLTDDEFHIDEPDNTWQSLSLAIVSESKLAVASSNPQGVFFLNFDDGELGDPLLPSAGKVASLENSPRWAVTQEESIEIFDNDTWVVSIPIPEGTTFHRQGLLAFTPQGNLVVTLTAQRIPEIYLVDPETKHFQRIVRWTGERLVSLGVAPKMTWDFDREQFGDELTVVSFDPPLPAEIALGERLRVTISYRLNSADEAQIFIRPMTDGQLSKGYSAHGSRKYSRGRGLVEGWFSFRQPTTVDQVRVRMTTSQDGEPVRLDRYFAAPALWSLKENPAPDAPVAP